MIVPAMAIVFTLTVVLIQSAQSQTFTGLYSFTGSTDGCCPSAGLTRDAAGNLYGTTRYGGPEDKGTVFELMPRAGGGWTEQTLYSFGGGTDGAGPVAGLILDRAGNLYGTTSGGGDLACGAPYGCGTVFRLMPQAGGRWTEQVLHSFGGGTDGEEPAAGLIFDPAGNLYGTTSYGGTYDYGVVFEITAGGGWREQVLHTFGSGGDGIVPYYGSLVIDAAGNLYGTTLYGGAYGSGGTVFELMPGGTERVLHSFGNGTDGAGPYAGLIMDASGNLYGTTGDGGDLNCHYGVGCGTVFELVPQVGGGWTETVLYAFKGTDGNYPLAGLIFDVAGNLYGTTDGGGGSCSTPPGVPCGTVFKLTPQAGGRWTEQVLHSFGGPDGAYPSAGLIMDPAGTLYGTTNLGGGGNCNGFGCGVVFEITGVAPPTFTISASPSSISIAQGNQGTSTITTSISEGFNNPITLSASGVPTDTTVMFNQNPIPAPGSGSSTMTITVGCGTPTGTYPITVTGNGGGDQQHTTVTLTVPAPVQYSLCVLVNGNGNVTSFDDFINCPGTCSHSYPDNAQVTLNATPAFGWTFTGWSGACSGFGACSVIMTQSLSVGATFVRNPSFYRLTASTSGNGRVRSFDRFINCPGMCSHSYVSRSHVTLNATPARGWAFAGWSGACSGTGSCNVTMTQNLSVTATFNEPGFGFQFIPVTPCRLVDTRQTGGPIQAGTSRVFNLPQLAQSANPPCESLSSAAAFSLNVSVVPYGPLSYLTIWPTGEAQPNTATMNSLDGRIKANAAIVQAGNQGAVSVFVTNTTNVVLDIDGYFAPVSFSTLAFYPLPPCRIADTSKSSFPPGLGQPYLTGLEERDFPILNATSCNIPSSAAAYSLNFTVVPHGPLGYMTVWPTGESRPTVSTLNDLPGMIIANAAIVPAGASGDVSVYPSSDTDLIIDINGYFAPGDPGGLSLYPTAPCRVIDTRKIGSGQPFSGTLSPPVNVVGSQCAPPSTARAYVFNATVVPSGALGYLTLWPDGTGRPTVSTLSALDGSITNNMAIVPSTNGKVDAYASGLTQLILDISSYFAP